MPLKPIPKGLLSSAASFRHGLAPLDCSCSHLCVLALRKDSLLFAEAQEDSSCLEWTLQQSVSSPGRSAHTDSYSQHHTNSSSSCSERSLISQAGHSYPSYSCHFYLLTRRVHDGQLTLLQQQPHFLGTFCPDSSLLCDQMLLTDGAA